MKKLLLNIIFCLSALTAVGQSVYEIVPEPTCWFISNQDSSLTRYLLVSSRTPGQISILGYVNAAGDVVDVSAGGFFTPGFCDCCNGSGSGSGDQDWLWPTTDKTNLNPIYHIGKVSVFTQDTTHGLRVDSDFQFNPEAFTTFDYQNLTDTTGTNYRGILYRAPGTFSGSSSLAGGSNNFTIALNAVPADRDRLGVYAFGGKLTGVPDIFESAWMEAFADGSWTGSSRSTGINFYVTDTTTTYNILTMEKGGRIELDKYGSFSDGTPLSMLGYNATSKDITRHPIGGTALPGYLLGLDDVGGFVWKDSSAYVDGNGIYGGSGTVPNGTIATVPGSGGNGLMFSMNGGFFDTAPFLTLKSSAPFGKTNADIQWFNGSDQQIGFMGLSSTHYGFQANPDVSGVPQFLHFGYSGSGTLGGRMEFSRNVGNSSVTFLGKQGGISFFVTSNKLQIDSSNIELFVGANDTLTINELPEIGNPQYVTSFGADGIYLKRTKIDSLFANAGTGYGAGNKEAGDLSKTESIYHPVYATDGTMIERRMNYGTASGTPDGSGDLTITHGLGATPTIILLGPNTANNYTYYWHTAGGTTFKINVMDAVTGLPITAGTVSISWEAK